MQFSDMVVDEMEEYNTVGRISKERVVFEHNIHHDSTARYAVV